MCKNNPRTGLIASAWSIAALAVVACVGCGGEALLGPVASARKAEEIREVLAAGSESTGGGDQAAASTGTGWATIRGRFLYDGNSPQMPPYNVNKDEATCKPGGRAPLQQTLVVDSATHGIKNVVVYLRDASRVHESAQPASDSVLFDQKVCVFLSHVIPVTVGQTIEIKNSDPIGHNTKIAGSRNSFNQTIPALESIDYVLQREEATPAPVSCSIHPWMSAYILPRDNRYVAVTAEDGSFEIANVPAGESLDVQVWHESATGPGGGLVLTSPEAKQLDWSNRGRFTIQLEPDEEKEVQLTVPPSAFRG
jgi:plastocyanin